MFAEKGRGPEQGGKYYFTSMLPQTCAQKALKSWSKIFIDNQDPGNKITKKTAALSNFCFLKNGNGNHWHNQQYHKL